jgi:Phosphodiester glycosidase
MKKKWRWGGTICILSVPFFLLLPYRRQAFKVIPAQKISPAFEYKVLNFPSSVAYILKIPKGSIYTIRPFVSDTVETVAQVGQKTGAIAVLNAGFFDPANSKTTSRVVIDRQEVASPEKNERLMNNPALSPYLDTILNRSEFRDYRCWDKTHYSIEARSVTHKNCDLEQAIAGGPQLLPINTAQPEGFTDYKNGTLIRDAIGATQRNARTAIGITADGSVVWVMIAQTPKGGLGMTLAELATVLKGMGVEKALNLDGGTSSSLYFKGQAHYGKLDENGQVIPRAVKSMLVLQARPEIGQPR